MGKKKYQIRGLFPSGDQTFESKAKAKEWKREFKRQGYKVDDEIYEY